MSVGKTVRSRRLGRMVRALREEAQLDQTTVAMRLGVSQSYLSRVEAGTKRLDEAQLGALAGQLRANSAQRARLDQLRAHADLPGWWQEYTDLVASPVEMLIELGEESARLRTFDNVYVQGMVQTRRYAEAVIGCGTAHVRMSDVDRLVDLRMRRQERLADENFTLLSVMTEGVLRQQVGGASVMREQIQHLLDVGEREHVDVRVLPFTAGAHPGMDSMVLFDLDPGRAPEAVYIDSDTAWRVHEEPNAVRRCAYTFQSVLDRALSAHESADLLRAAMKEM